MNRNAGASPEIHYHIRWVSSWELDWERHDTRAHAEESAKQLVRTDEGYIIEEFDEGCVQCRTLTSKKDGS